MVCSYLMFSSTKRSKHSNVYFLVPPPPPGCFPSTARVNLENGKSVTMSEIQMGFRVQIGK